MTAAPDKTAAPDVLLLCGPTASGKSAVALDLAARLNGEIVSVDSMQVYRGMDIGTAKPSIDERVRVPHHLVDILEPRDAFDAAMFLRLADAAVADIRARGRAAILCGGTGLYFKVFLYGLAPAAPANAAVKEALRAMPLEQMLAELKEADPVTFERMDRHNPRRVIRALEVIRLTGKPFSAQRVEWAAPRQDARCVCVGLAREPGDLRRRVEARVDAMFARGLVEETKALLERGLAQSIVAMQALGYRQVVEHLKGQRSLDETIALVKIRTWQFARKQRTWLRTQLQPAWVHARGETATSEMVAGVFRGETGGGFGVRAAALVQADKNIRAPSPPVGTSGKIADARGVIGNQ